MLFFWSFALQFHTVPDGMKDRQAPGFMKQVAEIKCSAEAPIDSDSESYWLFHMDVMLLTIPSACLNLEMQWPAG